MSVIVVSVRARHSHASSI